MVVTDLTDTFYANNKRTLRYTITDEDTTGSPAKDITGLVIKWALTRLSPTGDFLTTPVLEKSTASALEIARTTPLSGECEVYILPADTLTLFGDFYFELEVFDSLGANGVVVATGTITIVRNVVNT